MAKPPPIRHFYSKVAGISIGNRQKIAKRLHIRDELAIEHEPDNPADSHAMKLMTPRGKQVGYLPRDLAGEVLARSERGIITRAFVAGASGGGKGQYVGVKIALLVIQPGTSAGAIRRYVRKHIDKTGLSASQREEFADDDIDAESSPSCLWKLIKLLALISVIYFLYRRCAA